MDWQLSGKRAFVTAGAHGIGEAIANLLASEGASVVVADVDGEALGNRWAGLSRRTLRRQRVYNAPSSF